MTAAPRTLVVADAHVHVHDCYAPEGLFDGIHANLAAEAARRGARHHFTGVLFLTEGGDDDCFSRFAGLARRNGPVGPESLFGGWSFDPTQERVSLVASRDGARLVLVAGRQVAAAEDLEVLALGTLERFPDGRPIREVLTWARGAGALPVIPWGPGKWLFARERLLRSLLHDARQGELFLGDESSRPAFWPMPRPFALADARGLRNLPGSDPLPFARERARAGSYGFTLECRLELARPAEDLKRLLRDPTTRTTPFGVRESAPRFLRNQLAMQLRKRRRTSA